METKKLSTAVLHLDLTSAFHHLVRELVLGVAYEADINRIIQDLHEAGHPLEARSHGQRLIALDVARGSYDCSGRCALDAHNRCLSEQNVGPDLGRH